MSSVIMSHRMGTYMSMMSFQEREDWEKRKIRLRDRIEFGGTEDLKITFLLATVWAALIAVENWPPCFGAKIQHEDKFGIKRNNSFIALLGKGGCCRLWPSKSASRPRERAGGVVYSEIQALAGFGRNCAPANSPLCHFFRVGLGSWNKRLRRGEWRFAE